MNTNFFIQYHIEVSLYCKIAEFYDKNHGNGKNLDDK